MLNSIYSIVEVVKVCVPLKSTPFQSQTAPPPSPCPCLVRSSRSTCDWLPLCWISSACGARLVTAIRSALVKGRSSGDAVYAAAEETTNELKERIFQLHQIQKQAAKGSETGISPARVMYNLFSPARRLLWLSGSLYVHASPISSSSLHPQPKAYAVNHATAYGGRDTVKVLMALLDEEALTPPCPNKADLLSEDQPVLSGAEGTCVLMLFR